METIKDVVVKISPEREKFFGRSGTMLIPCPATVEALIREIPARKLLTTDALRQELAKRHNADVTCPAATQTALRTISRAAAENVPYWRVVKKDGALLPAFSVGESSHAALLTQEGFTLKADGKAPKVKNVAESLVRFS